MNDYKGLKIPEKITIVEKPIPNCGYGKDRTIPQGYVIPAGDKKALSSAHTWADYTNWQWDENLKRSVNAGEVLGIDHTYDNGKFKMTVKESAAGSWQGGKLSFWTCEIEAPDGKKFDIGINSDYLCETIMHNTLINGVVQGDVYLGKVKGNTMAVTKHQPSYAQAMHDEGVRTTTQSNKYNPGDLLKTLTEMDVYLGPWYELFDMKTEITRHGWWGYGRKESADVEVTLYAKPKMKHAFIGIWENTRANCMQYNSYIDIKNTKPKRILTGENRLSEVEGIYKKAMDKCRERDVNKDCRDYYSIYGFGGEHFTYTLTALRYSDTPKAKPDAKAIVEEIKAGCKKWSYDGKITLKNELGEVLQVINI